PTVAGTPPEPPWLREPAAQRRLRRRRGHLRLQRRRLLPQRHPHLPAGRGRAALNNAHTLPGSRTPLPVLFVAWSPRSFRAFSASASSFLTTSGRFSARLFFSPGSTSRSNNARGIFAWV